MMSTDLDFKLVKAAGAKTTYTPKQIKEMARCSKDPLYFMENYMWIQHPTRGRMQFEAYEYQIFAQKNNFKSTTSNHAFYFNIKTYITLFTLQSIENLSKKFIYEESVAY